MEATRTRTAPGDEVIVAMHRMLRSAGALTSSTFVALDETSQPVEVLLAVSRDGAGTLGAQIEDQLRRAIREGTLRAGTQVPSTRDLARQLGTSRRVAVEAYSQLAAEGYLVLRQGARPRVSQAAGVGGATETEMAPLASSVRFDFRPSMPDVSTFPRQAWLRSLRAALAQMTDADLGYGDPRGVDRLRAALAGYLGRVRGVVADPARVVVTCGYSQGFDLVVRALAERGATRIAFEDPSYDEPRLIAARAGLDVVPVEVDDRGLRVDQLERTRADAVVLTPAHQHPTGVVLAGERRTQLLAWLNDRDAIAIEDDYDADYRYDRAAIGALQGLDPDRVVYAGSASKTLVPALRLGWTVVPPALVEPVTQGKLLADRGTDRIEQYAFADFLERGELDRHLRRMRTSYRRRRDALVEALARELPDAAVRGIAAGLHATVELREGDHEPTIRAEAAQRSIAFATMSEGRITPATGPPVLLLGYGQVPEASIRAGIRELAEAIRAARAASPLRR
jgi:GntR family transcriptional regulator / MocR family aminotransferase